jgi:TPR repeat protein
MRSRQRFNPSRPSSPRRSGSDGGRILRSLVARAFLALALVLGLAGGAAAEKRVALVVGNSSYTGLKPLRNPGNDAADIAAALKGLGFEVTSGTDLDRAAMMRAIETFTAAARTADVSLFYYAGHGFQLASQNYLVPVDAVLRRREDVHARTVDLRSLLQSLEGSKGIHLVFLDACRNNPLASVAESAGAPLQNGLARVGHAAGFLIAFATQPDNVAFDGGGRNSPFSQAILSHLATRGQDIASMMIAVRKDVLAATGGYQVPWENSSLTRQFSFVPGPAAAASPETQLWSLAATARDPALLQIYLERHPEGSHAADARALLGGTKVAALPSGTARSTPGAEALGDDTLWDFARKARLRPLVELYLARNPAGRHAEEAREMLRAMPKPGSSEEPPEVACDRLATHPRDATANNPGTLWADLRNNAALAVDACRRAMLANPEMPHYAALLARALAAGGQREEAVRLYRDASNRGNLRAMVSLGLITETGDGVPKDLPTALALYERAAAGGSPDGAINLAVALMEGTGVKRDVPRAVALLTQASRTGSAIATYNLGVLAQQGVTGNPASAIDYFRRATALGDPRGYLAAAILLDEGRGLRKDPAAAAEMLLQGVALDSGEALNQIAARAANWSPDTIRAIQARLKKGGYYTGAVDGRGSARLNAALKQWRSVGSLDPTQGG